MQVLGPNDIGKGILIEYDAGTISPTHIKNKRIVESIKTMDQDEDIVLYAILQKCDVENRNGRVYPRDILHREVDNYQKLIDQGRALSELNHPESSLVDLERSSHRIIETFWDGETLMGKIQILTSPAYHTSGIVSCVGDIAANLLRHGVTLGVSSRGVGSLKQEGSKNLVQDDFELICFDLVSSPSTPGAYLFKNLEDKELYDEATVHKDEETELEEKNGSLRLMKKLDSYLSNY